MVGSARTPVNARHGSLTHDPRWLELAQRTADDLSGAPSQRRSHRERHPHPLGPGPHRLFDSVGLHLGRDAVDGDVLPFSPPVITGVRGWYGARRGGVAQPAWQHRRALARLSHYAVAHCCTTDHHKTHGTGAIDEGTVAYAWHPWSGERVRVHEVIVRGGGGGGVARCSRVDVPVARLQEIPLWMLDGSACASSRAAKEAITTIAALTALRLLLSEAIAGTAVSSFEEAIASCGHQRGDRHAAHPSPAADTSSSARSLRGDTAAGVGPGARMEQPAGSDPAGRDRLDDAPAWRARRRRGARCGERR